MKTITSHQKKIFFISSTLFLINLSTSFAGYLDEKAFATRGVLDEIKSLEIKTEASPDSCKSTVISQNMRNRFFESTTSCRTVDQIREVMISTEEPQMTMPSAPSQELPQKATIETYPATEEES